MIDTEKFPKHYNIQPELWNSEGEWRKYMTNIYTQKRMKNND